MSEHQFAVGARVKVRLQPAVGGFLDAIGTVVSRSMRDGLPCCYVVLDGAPEPTVDDMMRVTTIEERLAFSKKYRGSKRLPLAVHPSWLTPAPAT